MSSNILLADRIKQFMSRQSVSEYKVKQLQNRYRLATNKILSIEQQDLLYNLLNKPITILNGGPGTNKNKTVATVVDIYKMLYSDATVTIVNSNSIVNLLKNSSNINADLIVVSQFHLVDISLACKLFNAMSLNTKVLLVGDIEQIPNHSVNILKSLVVAGIPTITQTVLGAKVSSLLINAHRIKYGHSITCTDNFEFIDTADNNIPTEIKNITERLLADGYKKDDILIYAPNKNTSEGIAEVNNTHSSALVVIVLLPEEQINIVTRNYLYTVLTRAEERVILIGSYKTLDAARFNDKGVEIDLHLVEGLTQKVHLLRRRCSLIV